MPSPSPATRRSVGHGSANGSSDANGSTPPDEASPMLASDNSGFWIQFMQTLNERSLESNII